MKIRNAMRRQLLSLSVTITSAAVLLGCAQQRIIHEPNTVLSAEKPSRSLGASSQAQTNNSIHDTASAPHPSTLKDDGTASSATNRPLPQFLIELLRNPSKPPDFSLMTNVEPAHVDILIHAYLSTTQLTNRIGLASALSFIGDDRAMLLFLNTLTNEFARRTLSEREVDVMETLATRFGVLGRRSDAAYHFIIEQGSWPSFWSRHRSWKCSDSQYDEFVNDFLAGWCIQSLGYSKRPDLDSVLEELKSRYAEGFPTRFSGAIEQAAFYQFVIQKYGDLSSRATKTVLGNADNSFREFMKWRESPEGKTWAEWSDRVNRTK